MKLSDFRSKNQNKSESVLVYIQWRNEIEIDVYLSGRCFFRIVIFLSYPALDPADT